MIYDTERNEIDIIGYANGSKLVLGKTGFGKTFFAYRQLEEEVKRGHRIIILDYSGSFSEAEMDKNQWKMSEKLLCYDPNVAPVSWGMHYEKDDKAIADLTDALISSFSIRSYAQKKLLRDFIQKIMRSSRSITLENLVSALEHERKSTNKEKDTEYRTNLKKLIDRLSMNGLDAPIEFKVDAKGTSSAAQVTVVQLDDLPEMQKSFFSNLFLELIWKETANDVSARRWDVVVLDEIQHLSCKPGSALSVLLTEGRKKQLSVWVITQHLAKFTASEVEDLWQADSVLIFRPTPESRDAFAKRINSQERIFWNWKLASLDRGKFVFIGNYKVNGKKKVINTPLICELVNTNCNEEI